MPILFRHLLGNYFKSFFLCVGSFVSILIVSRFKEMARFAAISNDFLKTALFSLYQIPAILPFAFPIAALVASFLLSHRMSEKGEMTALFTSGCPQKWVLSPLLLIAFGLGLGSFSISADLSPLCRGASKRLLFDETSSNPSLLLQKKSLFNTSTYLKMDDENLVLVISHKKTGELQLFTSSYLEKLDNEVHGSDVGGILQQNQKTTTFFVKELFAPIEQESFSLRLKDLTFKELRKEGALTEMVQRSFLAFSVFTFTMLGFIFGIHLPRFPNQNLAWVFLIALLTLVIFFALKSIPSSLLFPVALFPHVFITLVSLKKLRTIS